MVAALEGQTGLADCATMTRIPIALFEDWLSGEADVLSGEGQLVLRFRDAGDGRGFEIIAEQLGLAATLEPVDHRTQLTPCFPVEMRRVVSIRIKKQSHGRRI